MFISADASMFSISSNSDLSRFVPGLPYVIVGCDLFDFESKKYLWIWRKWKGYLSLCFKALPAGKISWIEVALTSVSDVGFTLVFG